MKVRWTRGSLRLRITPTELVAILQGEPVTEGLPLAGWSVRVTPGTATDLQAEGAAVVLTLARADAKTLGEPEREGIYFDRAAEPPMRFFIEKDFPCIHPHAMEALETPTETFAEPQGFRARKAEG